MPGIEQISDPGDKRLGDYVRLTDLALRTRSEVADGLFLAEGELITSRALDAGLRPRSFLLAENRLSLVRPELLERMRASGAPIFVGAHPVLEAVTGYHVHRGALASFHRPALPSVASVLAEARSVLVLEEVNNHTNVGAIVRCAAALGVDALLLDPRSADPLYRRAIRVSMGSVFTVRWTRLTPWPEGLAVLRDHGFRVVAMTLAPGSRPLQEVTPDHRTAMLLGAEGGGLSAAATAAADVLARIPMAAGVDSLNVAAAAAIACWHLYGSG